MADQTTSPAGGDTRIRAALECLQNDDFENAFRIAANVLRSDSRNVVATNILGRILNYQGSYDQAIHAYTRLVELAPDEIEGHVGLAKAYLGDGQTQSALDALDGADRINPDFPESLLLRGRIYDRIHQYDKVREVIERLEHIDCPPHALLLLKIQLADSEGDKERLVELATPLVHGEVPGVPNDTRLHTAYLLGKALDKLGDADGAMAAWGVANTLGRRPYDRFEEEARTNDELDFFSRRRLDVLAKSTNSSELPVFIAGMPRTGTTLVEQILDAHPKITGVGEIRDLVAIQRDIPRTLRSAISYPNCLSELTTETADQLAQKYINIIRAMAGPQAERIVNKSLGNYHLVGLIELLFPKARIIYVRRHPIDNCLSIYMNPFHLHSNSWANDLGDIAFHRKQVDRYLAHWQEISNLPILDVQYEELVANPEEGSRRLIDFCGLEWDDRCLEFHKSKRTVMTLSYNQVNKPIYSSAIGRYEKYKRHLDPVFEVLGLERPDADGSDR